MLISQLSLIYLPPCLDSLFQANGLLLLILKSDFVLKFLNYCFFSLLVLKR